MDLEFNSYIFEPREGADVFEERKNLIGWLTLLVSVLFIILDIDWLGLTLIGMLFLTCMTIALTRWNQLEPLNGSYPERLTINQQEIKIGDKSYPMNRLTIINLTYSDYKMQLKVGYIFFVRYNGKSNGTWNHLWFKYEGKVFRYRFGLDSDRHARQLEQLTKEIGRR